MDYFARQNMMIPKPTADLIKNIRILVVGIGAGGNEVLKNLLLMGFGNFTIIDFDHVEDSNLSRTTLFRKEDIGKSKSLVAAERLKEIALHSEPNIVGLHGNIITDFGKGLFLEHDIVICCVDTQKARAYINDWCVLTKTPYFEMGFSEYDVNICFFAPDGEMIQQNGKSIAKLPSDDGTFPNFKGEFPVCLREEIGYGSFNEKRNSCSNFKVKDESLSKIPTIQVSAAMAGVLIATELVKYLSGIDTIKNKMLLYFGRTYETMICNYERSPKCQIHNKQFNLLVLDKGGIDTVRDLIVYLMQRTKSEVFLYLQEDYIISGRCHICGNTIEHNKSLSKMWNEERWCNSCRDNNEDYEHIINFGSNILKIPKELKFNSPDYVLDSKLDSFVLRNDILEVFITNEDKYMYIYLKS